MQLSGMTPGVVGMIKAHEEISMQTRLVRKTADEQRDKMSEPKDQGLSLQCAL